MTLVPAETSRCLNSVFFLQPQVYSRIDDHKIGPEFLGYPTEEGGVIGFLMEKAEGRHATIADLTACEMVVGRLHGLRILHGDLNKHNF